MLYQKSFYFLIKAIFRCSWFVIPAGLLGSQPNFLKFFHMTTHTSSASILNPQQTFKFLALNPLVIFHEIERRFCFLKFFVPEQILSCLPWFLTHSAKWLIQIGMHLFFCCRVQQIFHAVVTHLHISFNTCLVQRQENFGEEEVAEQCAVILSGAFLVVVADQIQ